MLLKTPVKAGTGAMISTRAITPGTGTDEDRHTGVTGLITGAGRTPGSISTARGTMTADRGARVRVLFESRG